MLDITTIPAPRVPFIDSHTGFVSREWYMFLLSLFRLTGSGGNFTSLDELQQLPFPPSPLGEIESAVDQSQLGPVSESLVPETDAVAQYAQTLQNGISNLQQQLDTVRQYLETLPPPSLSVVMATLTGSLSGGSAGSIPYQSAPDTTVFLPIGAAAQVLQVNGAATAPEWSAVTGTDEVVRKTSPTMATPKVTTTLGVGNATPAASGAGLTFPSTQSASSDVNTLDDYEEGTWVPSIFLATGQTGSFTFTQNSGLYLKIGKLVHIQGFIAWTAKPTAGTVLRMNLPFTAASGNTTRGGFHVSYSNTAFSGITVYNWAFRGEDGDAFATANYSNATDGTINQTIDNANLPTAGSFMVHGTFVASA